VVVVINRNQSVPNGDPTHWQGRVYSDTSGNAVCTSIGAWYRLSEWEYFYRSVRNIPDKGSGAFVVW
jgi:hypothetical protein